jgi:PAS domain S-box-containing protein
MTEKPTYEELEQRVKDLEQEVVEGKQMEKSFRETENIRQLLTFAPFGVFLIDLSGKIVAANRRGAERFGKTVEEIIGKHLNEYTPPDVAEKRRLKGWEVIESLKPTNFEDQIDGSWYHNTIFPILDDQGNITHLGVYGADITERKGAEEALRQSEERYRAVVEQCSEGIYLLDPDKKQISHTNRAIQNMLGYTSKEISKRIVYDLLAHDKEDVDSKMQQVIKEKHYFVGERKYRRKDGSLLDVEASASLIYFGGREVLCVVVRDISERKRAEEALKESEKRYRDIFENVSDLLYFHDLRGNFIQTNLAFQKESGYGQEELRNLNIMDLIAEAYKHEFEDYFKRILEKGKDEGLMRVMTKNGSELIVEYKSSLVYGPQGPIEVRGSARDITERVLAAKALKQSEEKYRTILESIEDGYYEVDVTGSFTFFNDSFCRILGYSEDELMGINYGKYCAPADVERVYQTFNRVYATSESVKRFDWEIIKKDGDKVHLEVSVYLMKNPEGQRIGFGGIVRDITERKRAEKERRKLEAQVVQAQKMEAIGTLAGGIAHDFNNLLMGIQGRTSLMTIDTHLPRPHLEHLKGIEDCVRSAADLTKQLLGFARGGRYEVKPTDLNETVKNQNRLFGRTKKEITIHAKYGKDLWPAEVDEGQIEQVLLNLYVNAWQAMPGGGELYLQTENVTLDEDFAKPFTVEAGKYVKISVTDTGVGMDDATRQRIFEPFFTTKEMGRGTGLGLASAYGIIKNHGGFINVYSEKGVGTTFNIYLPASEKEVIEDKMLSDEVLKGTETILLVDDEEMVADAGGQLLEEIGYSVLIARSGKEAIEIYEKNRDQIGLVILDMIMPVMGGGETYDRLKEANPDIKVLLSSGYSINGEASEILDRGCSGFIQKPFNVKELSQKIRGILDKN